MEIFNSDNGPIAAITEDAEHVHVIERGVNHYLMEPGNTPAPDASVDDLDDDDHAYVRGERPEAA